MAEEAAADASASAGDKKPLVSGAKIRGMLKLLANEAGFLINPDVVKSLEGLPEDDAKLESAETLLKVLGVKSEEKLAALVKYFFTDNKTAHLLQQGDVDAVEEAEAELTLHNAPEDVAELRDMISPEDVMMAVSVDCRRGAECVCVLLSLARPLTLSSYHPTNTYKHTHAHTHTGTNIHGRHQRRSTCYERPHRWRRRQG